MNDQIQIVEVGLRDGLQMVEQVMATPDKIIWLGAEYGAGIRHFEVGSFVPAKLLPQMADTASVVTAATDLAQVEVAVLAPNLKGATAAVAAGVNSIVIPLSASKAHSQANVRRTPEEMVAEVVRIRAMRDESNRSVRIIGGIGTAFGCTIQGAVPEDDVVHLAEALMQAGVDAIGLADTVGYANPAQVRRLFGRVRAVTGERLHSAHFHDTRGLGLANVVAALDVGIRCFDASLGGLGGCPHAPGASGNIATEDLVFMLEAMGLNTGVDLDALIEARQVLGRLLPGQTLYGKLASVGLPKHYYGETNAVA